MTDIHFKYLNMKTSFKLSITICLFVIGNNLNSQTELPSNPQHPMYGLNLYVPAYDINYATNTDWYGSGDVNGDGIIDMADYNSSISGTNPFNDGTHRGDTDLNGISGKPADKAIILEYINGTRTHINMWELETIAEKRNHLAKAIAIDKTDEINGLSAKWLCGNYSAQTFINFNGVYDIENTIFAQDNGTNLQHDISHNGIFRIPLRNVSTWTGSGVAHAINNVYLGSPENQDATAFENRIYIEPQTDDIVAPGNYSLNQNAYEKIYSYYYHNFFGWLYSGRDLIDYNITKNPPEMRFRDPSLVISWNPFQDIEYPVDQNHEYFPGIEDNYATLSGELVGKYPGTKVNKTLTSGQINDGTINQVNYDVNVLWNLIAGAYNSQNTSNATKNQILKIRDTTPPIETSFPADTTVGKNEVQNAIRTPTYSDNSGLPITHSYEISLDQSTSDYNRWIVNHTGKDIAGNSKTSPQYITEDLRVGIDEPQESLLEHLVMLSNPNSNPLKLVYMGQQTKSLDVDIYNLKGNKVKDNNPKEYTKGKIQEYDISGLSSGLYLIKIKDILENKTYFMKMIYIK